MHQYICHDMETENKISVVINTYNAARYLQKALEAAKEFDEIVVCDMESTDDTCEIARRYGCKIVTFPKNGITIVEPARNFAIQSATHKWVLVVDADEIITDKLRIFLYNAIKKSDCPTAYFIPRHNKFMGEFSRDWAHDYQLRFMQKEKCHWPPTIHSIPLIDGVCKKAPAKCKFLHLADETMQQWVNKMNQYTDNEVSKKASKNYGVFTLIWRPAWRFFRSYVLQGGFMSGRRGFVSSYLSAVYQVVAIAKIIEKRIRE